jgi:23S rRNA (cytidine1920-2'-O)/16S rRNA (cytidine1409-2'-O)-methyltransferase
VIKQRLDESLVVRGLFQSRARARDAILRGTVELNGKPATKPAQSVSASDSISINDPAQHYVSRAALKLIHALDHFSLDVKGRTCLDIGASTGGFTQVLLERGAARVTAIDVGHGQMAQEIFSNPRVQLIEGLNARDLTFPLSGYSLIVCDVSFISLKLALPATLERAPAGCWLIALIKPQFEVGRNHLAKDGIVKDAAQQQEVCKDISAFLSALGWLPETFVPSPMVGGDGNQEFLVAARKSIT